MAENRETHVAPDRRLGKEEVQAQSREVTSESLLSQTLDRLQGMIAVVNEQRQVVYANRAFLDYTRNDDLAPLCGMRPGEIFHCIHARETAGGCGNSENCRFCGAMQAMIETQTTGMPATKECRIASVEDGKSYASDLQVRTTPFEISGVRFILLSFRDVSSQKRKIALERIFFHDILNTASSIRVYLDLLKTGISDEGSLKLLERLESISATLIEEIQSQKILVSAENRTLKVQRSLITSNAFADHVVQQFEDQEVARGKRIVAAPFSEAFSFVSDDSLLRRVLFNMVKNALEATGTGAEVTVGYGKPAGEKVRFWVHNPTYIEEDIQRQIFQRYFSTKGEDRGLGTYSMKLLSEEYLGGKIDFESTREKGTTFGVTLPLRP